MIEEYSTSYQIWLINFNQVFKWSSWMAPFTTTRVPSLFPKLDYHTCKERRSVLTLLTMMWSILSQGANVCYSNQSTVVCHNALSAQCEYLQFSCVQICIPFLKNLWREAILHGSYANHKGLTTIKCRQCRLTSRSVVLLLWSHFRSELSQVI